MDAHPALSRLEEAARLFSLYFRLPAAAARRDALPLEAYRRRAVFLESAQPFCRAAFLSALLADKERRLIYLLDDPLGTHAVLVLADDAAVLLGPFADMPYEEKACRRLLSRFTKCDSALLLQFKLFWCDLSVCAPGDVLRAARSILEYAGLSPDDFPVAQGYLPGDAGRGGPRTEEPDLPPWRLEAVQKVEDRYAAETALMLAVREGNEEEARAGLRHLLRTSRPQMGMAVDLWSQESAMAIMRNMIRLAAKPSGLDPVIIDGISLDYAQKMRRLSGEPRAAAQLYADMIGDLCREIRRTREENWSVLTVRALYIIRREYARPLTIGTLAQTLEVSESTLARSLRADTGRTFTQHLKAARMEAAARLLSSTSAPVQAVAEKVGIPDQNYFVKVFRSVYGAAPGEYRNRSLFGRASGPLSVSGQEHRSC